jgi:hypothetical protein
MAETRLRQLERRFRATGSVEDEAAYLQERVRVGDLGERSLELAAYLEHPAARLACSLRKERREGLLVRLARALTGQAPEFRRWSRGLVGYGKQPALRGGPSWLPGSRSQCGSGGLGGKAIRVWRGRSPEQSSG